MKKLLLLFSCLGMCLTACQNNDELNGEDNTPKFTIEAVMDGGDDTRAIVDLGGKTKWEDGDEIDVMKETSISGPAQNYKFTASDLREDNKRAKFTTTQEFQLDADNAGYFAGYPYGSFSSTFIPTIDCKINAVQTYDAVNMVAPKCNPSVAAETKAAFEANPLFHFKNICGLLRLKFKGNATIKKISFTSKEGQYVCGTYHITDPTFNTETLPTWNSGTGSNTVTLDCGSGVTLDETNPKEFYIVLPPATYNGFTIEAEDVDGNIKQYTSTKDHVIQRSQIHGIATLEFKNEGVWYNIDNAGWRYWGTSTTLPETPATSSFALKTDEDFTFSEAQMAAVNTYVKTSKTNGSIAVDMSEAEYVNNSIGANTFSANTKIKTVALPKNVDEIGDYAFYNCGYLTGVSSTKVISKVGKATFMNNKKLLTIPDMSNITAIPDQCFADCNVLGPTFPYTQKVTTIGLQAFIRCYAITEIANSESVTTITGERNFSNCEGLLSLPQFPNVVEYPPYCFFQCKKIKNLVIPEGAQKLNSYSFAFFEGMESLELPSTLTYMEVSSVGYCVLLHTIICHATTAPTYVVNGGGYCPFLTGNGKWPGASAVGDKVLYIPASSTGYYGSNWETKMKTKYGWTFANL